MYTCVRLLCACALPLAAAAAADAQCQLQKLVPADAVFQQQTGEALAIDGDLAVLGAPFDDDLGPWSGSAYVYERVGEQWIETAKLHASDGVTDDRFAFSVAVDQGVIVVGTRYKQDMGYGTGAAYVYEKVGGAWTETQKLLAHDAVNDQFFGNSVAVSGDVIVVGAYLDDELGYAAGAAYVFERSGASWVETQRLTASDGALDDRFGWDVAASTDLLLIGAHGADVAGQQSGAAYVFEREGGIWTQRKKLAPGDAKEGARFGYSLDIAGDWAIVGSPFDDAGGPGAGAAYVWKHKGNTWIEFQKLTAPDAQPDDLFGEQVALKDNLAIASAWGVDGVGFDSGAAYLFRNTGLLWSEKARLAPTDVAELDNFAKSIDVSGDTVLVGSSQDDDLDDRVGAAYVFSASATNCPPLYAEPETIRLVLGGSQFFTLRPAVQITGDLYLLLGSLSGTQPGFSIGSFQVPLNPDPYFKVTLLYPNVPPLSTSFAALDADGHGAARFTLPATRDPALSGLTVNHAYGVLDATTFQLLFVSPPSHLSFL
jgi:hypothetical protein